MTESELRDKLVECKKLKLWVSKTQKLEDFKSM